MEHHLKGLFKALSRTLADIHGGGQVSDRFNNEELVACLAGANKTLLALAKRTHDAEARAKRCASVMRGAGPGSDPRGDPQAVLLRDQLELREQQLQQAADRSRELEAQNSALRQQLCGAAGAHGGGPCPAAEAHQAAAAALAAQLQKLEEANEALWRRTEALRVRLQAAIICCESSSLDIDAVLAAGQQQDGEPALSAAVLGGWGPRLLTPGRRARARRARPQPGRAANAGDAAADAADTG
jgi:hypothetical protein